MVVTGLVSPAGHIQFDFSRHWQRSQSSCSSGTAVGAIVRSVSFVAASRPTLDEAHWYHAIVAMMLPYVAIVWGIVNLSRGKYRSGRCWSRFLWFSWRSRWRRLSSSPASITSARRRRYMATAQWSHDSVLENGTRHRGLVTRVLRQRRRQCYDYFHLWLYWGTPSPPGRNTPRSGAGAYSRYCWRWDS